MPAHHSCAGILRILDIMFLRLCGSQNRPRDSQRFRKIGAKRLYLEGNTKLEASIHLYRKLGFHEISLEGSTYDRCDIIMELKL